MATLADKIKTFFGKKCRNSVVSKLCFRMISDYFFKKMSLFVYSCAFVSLCRAWFSVLLLIWDVSGLTKNSSFWNKYYISCYHFRSEFLRLKKYSDFFLTLSLLPVITVSLRLRIFVTGCFVYSNFLISAWLNYRQLGTIRHQSFSLIYLNFLRDLLYVMKHPVNLILFSYFETFQSHKICLFITVYLRICFDFLKTAVFDQFINQRFVFSFSPVRTFFGFLSVFVQLPNSDFVCLFFKRSFSHQKQKILQKN